MSDYTSCSRCDFAPGDLIDGKYESINDLLIRTGESILEDINVFKNKEHGKDGMFAFLKELGL